MIWGEKVYREIGRNSPSPLDMDNKVHEYYVSIDANERKQR